MTPMEALERIKEFSDRCMEQGNIVSKIATETLASYKGGEDFGAPVDEGKIWKAAMDCLLTEGAEAVKSKFYLTKK